VEDLPRKKQNTILTDEIRQYIDNEMKKDDELTSTTLKEMIEAKWQQVTVSTSTIRREKCKMDWVCTRPHYCQLLRRYICTTA